MIRNILTVCLKRKSEFHRGITDREIKKIRRKYMWKKDW